MVDRPLGPPDSLLRYIKTKQERKRFAASSFLPGCPGGQNETGWPVVVVRPLGVPDSFLRSIYKNEREEAVRRFLFFAGSARCQYETGDQVGVDTPPGYRPVRSCGAHLRE